MLEKSSLETVEINGQLVRYRLPNGDGPHPVILLLHGWTGDENTMWVFGPHLPSNALLIAPRAPHTATQGGYSWRIFEPGQPPSTIDDFRPAADALLELMAAWPAALSGNFDDLRIVGFSQGAALAHTLAIVYPERIRAFACLAGFIPRGGADLLLDDSFDGKSVFIAHGTKDPLIDVERAREAVQFLQRAGANVTYCEADIGHKLSLDCFRGLGSFFT